MEGLLLPGLGGAMGTPAPLHDPESPSAGRGDQQGEAGCGSRKLRAFHLAGAKPERRRAEEPVATQSPCFPVSLWCLLFAWTSLTRARVRYTARLWFAYISHL